MSGVPKLYIAGMGMITPVGANTAMTAAAVRAGVSGYTASDYYAKNGEPITMATIPLDALHGMDADIVKGNPYNLRMNCITRAAIQAIREACAQAAVRQPMPLLIAMPEGQVDSRHISVMLGNLEKNCQPWVKTSNCRRYHTGRAAGMEALGFVFRYMADSQDDYFLVGGSDSHRDYNCLYPHDEAGRLLTSKTRDGFAPGEAAGFLLLTRRPDQALVKNGHCITIAAPGLADEPGHLSSNEPYRGEGLDRAFKQALVGMPAASISAIYSSMNGENHWAKEYGVAYTRSKKYFRDAIAIEHPADSLGDIGAATAPVLIALAAENLWNNRTATSYLIYSSSDSAKRGAVVVEKIAAQSHYLKSVRS